MYGKDFELAYRLWLKIYRITAYNKVSLIWEGGARYGVAFHLPARVKIYVFYSVSFCYTTSCFHLLKYKFCLPILFPTLSRCGSTNTSFLGF